jgi:hypothetical protein
MEERASTVTTLPFVKTASATTEEGLVGVFMHPASNADPMVTAASTDPVRLNWPANFVICAPVCGWRWQSQRRQK